MRLFGQNMKKFKNSRLSTDFRKLETMALKVRGPVTTSFELGLGKGGKLNLAVLTLWLFTTVVVAEPFLSHCRAESFL